MGSTYPLEKKNQILGRILSKEITVAQEHREYGIAESCLYHWLKAVKTSGAQPVQRAQPAPLPRGMNLRAAIVAEGYCQEVGFDSPAAGKYCRAKGITLEEIKRFSAWLAQHDGDVVLSASARAREQELINKVSELNEEHKQQNRELQRKEKALAEAAALLVLTKKAQANWGGGQGKMISARDRRKAVELVTEAVAAGARAIEACKCLGIAFSSYLKWRDYPEDEGLHPKREFAANPRALSSEQRQTVYERYCQPDVCDLSVRPAFYVLLDKGEYLASESTVYRVLRHYKANVRRDGVRPFVKRHKPTSYEATGPNQVWTWDIAYLRDAEHSTRFYYAFAVIDIYSRYMVHYDVFEAETAQNAVRFLSEAIDKYYIRPRCLVLHSDNGATMKASETLGLVAVRGVEFSHSRPRVSNDNPYSESLFKTMKYTGHMGKHNYHSLEECKKKGWPHLHRSTTSNGSWFIFGGQIKGPLKAMRAQRH